MVRVILFDRFGDPLGELSEDEVFGLVRTEKVNGEHSLTITTTRVLEKGWRVLTCDARGIWREHVVYGTDALHDSAERPFGSYYCVWSVQPDLMGTRVSAMPGVINPTTAALALDAALGGTRRWARGTVTQTTTGGASMYDTDGWSAMGTLVETWGGEVDTTIGVGSAGVVSRQVDLYDKQGDQSGRRRFDFGADIKSVRRRIEDGPLYCRITPRGRGEETEGGGYGRKITIESVNDGKDYLVNSAMVDLAKLPDGSGGWEYPTLEIENPDIETPTALKAWAQSVLEEYTVPKVTYEVDVLQLAREGVDMHGVSLGDAVQVVDRKFGGLRIAARVMEMTVNMLDEADAQLTIGQVADDLSTMFGGFGTRLNTVANAVYNMNGGTYSTAGFLSRLLERLNEEINADGGYAHITEGHGILCYDTAVSDPLVGAEASKVVEIKGGSIRIANTKTAQGAWEWKTVFTSGHIAANLVTAAQLTAGYIGSASSGNYWDLDSGYMRVSGDIVLGGLNNTDGTMVVKDASGNELSKFDNSGAYVKGDFKLLRVNANEYQSGRVYGGYNMATYLGKVPNIPVEKSNMIQGGWQSDPIVSLHGLEIDIDNGFPPSASAYSIAKTIIAPENAAFRGSCVGSNGPLILLSYFDTTSYRSSWVRIDNTYVHIDVNSTNYTGSPIFALSSSGLTLRAALSVTGTKNRLVDTDSYGDRLLYCYETPSPMFGDVGSGKIGDDGLCYVEIDDVFSETARTDIAYQVFLQACGQGELYVSDKTPTHFVVCGTPGLAFDWELKAKQSGYEHLRLDDRNLAEETDSEREYGMNVLDAYAEELNYSDEIERILYEAA
jgi:phage minor structural protein